MPIDVNNSYLKNRIYPEYSKEEFLRRAWIHLAKEDAPLDVFNCSFEAVEEMSHQVVTDQIEADVSFQASVGYDRQEPYIDYEYYTEKEPYIAYERQYNYTKQQWEERQVIKYKDVQRQRQVTRYKTVTDWSPFSGSNHFTSVNIVENQDNLYLDENRFLNNKISTATLEPLSEEEAEALVVSERTENLMKEKHIQILRMLSKRSLPGDHCRDLDMRIDEITHTEQVVTICPEYKTTLFWDNQKYEFCAFPYGPMIMSGERIPNNISLESETERMKEELEESNKKRRNMVEKNVAKKTMPLSIVTIALLTASIVISCLIHVMALVLIAFALAVGAFVWNTILIRVQNKKEWQMANSDITKAIEETELQIANYAVIHKNRMLQALNSKLQSLSLEPVTAEELGMEERPV